MNSKLKLVSTVGMSKQQWLNFRMNGIGGSEVGTILGLNQYQSNVELFYKKLGEVPDEPDNLHMFWGREHEDTIADKWQYYDPNDRDPANYIFNKNEEKIIRKCRRV